MLHGVYIDMLHDSSLTTVAMLSAYTESSSKHYLDLLIPFVEYCIPSNVGATLDYNMISTRLGDEFGIPNMPENVVRAILRRYVKNNPNAAAKRDGNSYTVCGSVDTSSFDQRRRTIRAQMDVVAIKLDEFVSTQPWKKPAKNAKELLLSFFQAYGLTVVDNVDELHLVSAKIGSEMFIVAKFILWAYQNDQSLFSSLTDLTKGFLTYRAIYQIDEGEKHDHLSKLHNVKCYLDCSILISLLGYDTPESQASVQSLLQMLRSNGAYIYVFEHTIDEAKYLLMSYADSTDKLRFRLPGIKAKHLSDTVIRTQALALDGTITRLGVNKSSVSDEIVEKERISAASLFNFIRDSQSNGHRSEYDFKSIIGIKDLRKNSHPLMIENCYALLITQDTRLAYSVQKQTPSMHHEVTLAKLDADIIALLWIQSFTACPSMPQEMLLSNAAAAVTLSDDVRKRAIELTDMWVTDGSMDPSMASVLRSDRFDELILADHTTNDPAALSYDVFKSVMKDMLSPEIEAEKENVRKQERDEFSRRSNEEKAKYQREIAERDASEQHKVRDAETKRLIAQSRHIDRKATQHSKNIRSAAKWIGIALLAAIAIVASVFQISDVIKSYTEATNVAGTTPSTIPWWLWVYRVFMILLSVYGIITFFIDGKLTFRRCLDALERKLYETFYKHYEKVSKEWSDVGNHGSLDI